MKKILLCFAAPLMLIGCAVNDTATETDEQSAPTDGVGFRSNDPTFIRSDSDPLERHERYIGL